MQTENDRLLSDMRRVAPKKPNILPGILSAGVGSDMSGLVSKSSPAQLLPCSKCGRTFLPERVKIHQKMCPAGKEADNPRNKPGARTRSRTEHREVKEERGSLSKSWGGAVVQEDDSPPSRPGTATLIRPSTVTLKQRDQVTIDDEEYQIPDDRIYSQDSGHPPLLRSLNPVPHDVSE